MLCNVNWNDEILNTIICVLYSQFYNIKFTERDPFDDLLSTPTTAPSVVLQGVQYF